MGVKRGVECWLGRSAKGNDVKAWAERRATRRAETALAVCRCRHAGSDAGSGRSVEAVEDREYRVWGG